MSENVFWSSRTKFVLAAAGSAIGLGNLWRFPYMCYEYGGGAFLIPYIIALFTAAIPLMFLEISLGKMTKSASPRAFSRILDGKYAALGWIAPIAALIVVFYYSIIIGWSISYAGFSLDLAWGSDPGGFFYNTYLHISQSPLDFGGLSLTIIGACLIVWFLIFASLSKGVRSIEKAVYLTVILPWILIVVFVIRGITLPGAMDGLAYYLTPDLSKIMNIEVWIAAYAQIIASLSVALGILIAYSKSLPDAEDVVRSSLYVAFFNCMTSFVAGFAVFSALGYLAHINGVAVTEVVKGGIELVFVAYPAAISAMPLFPEIFGVLFFLMIVMLGVDSAFSLVDSTSCAFQDYIKIPAILTTGIVCIAGFIGSFLFATGSGLFWLDIFDHYVWYYLVILVGLLEALAVGYVYGADRLREYFNRTTDIKVGEWWTICIKFITPAILGLLLVYYLYEGIINPYGGYGLIPTLAGWMIVILTIAMAVFVGHIMKKRVI